jgi:two-component system, cell cycle sensor histidine kinase and response regulator CckA
MPLSDPADTPRQHPIDKAFRNVLGGSVRDVMGAITHLKQESVDLFVLDMIMDPGLDGLETYKQIIALHPGQKAILTSGFSETERVTAAQALGAGAYVKKPYTLENIGVAAKNELHR